MLHARPTLCQTESENLPVNSDLLGVFYVPMCDFVQSTKSSLKKTSKKVFVFSNSEALLVYNKTHTLNTVCSFLSTEIHMGSSSHHRIPQRKGSSVPTSVSFVYEQGSFREGDVTHPQTLSGLTAQPELEPGDQRSPCLPRDPDTDSPLLGFRENKPKNKQLAQRESTLRAEMTETSMHLSVGVHLSP